jgi:hypothetical protein
VGKLIVVTLTSEADAKAVRQALLDVQQKYTWVTLADYMEFVGRPSTFADEKVGWTELKGLYLCVTVSMAQHRASMPHCFTRRG